MKNLKIRRATVEDAEAMAELSSATFVETFGHLYKPNDLLYYLSIAYTPEQYSDDLQSDYAAWVVVDENNTLHGYAYAGPCSLPHADVLPEDRELKRLYMRASVQGGGWGAKLFEHALAWMKASEAKHLWLGVYSENYGAQRFYQRFGFSKVGEYLFPVGEARDREFIYNYPMNASS